MNTHKNSIGPKWISWACLAEYMEKKVATVRENAPKRGCRLWVDGGIPRGILAADLDKMYTIVDPEAVEFS